MYVETVPNRNSPPAILLREGWREGGRVRKRTLANLSDWPPEQIDRLRRVLKGERLISADQALELVRSLPHGHVAAVVGLLRRLGLERLLDRRRQRRRDLVVAMIAARLLDPRSKLATARGFRAETASSSLGETLGISTADEDELYEALDWLLERQPAIEQALAKRHLGEGSLALYDLTSTYFEGRQCPLARHGYSRDQRSGNLQIVFGLLTDSAGCPVAVEVFEGNTADPATVAAQVSKLRERFGLKRLVLVGDRGMLTAARIAADLRPLPGVDWITALKSVEIAKLASDQALQMSLFDERDLAEISHPDYPGERLVACFNPLLAEQRKRTREELLGATEKKLDEVAAATRREKRPLRGANQIALRVGKLLGRSKMGKHCQLEIADDRFSWQWDRDGIAREAALDGVYVIRTSLKQEESSAEQTVRRYKSLAAVERAFRSFKSVDLKVRPIYHRAADRVRAHVFLCLLAYYVEWHMRKRLAPLLFDDDDRAGAQARRSSIVAPAERSERAERKARGKRTAEGFAAHSFQTLLRDLATITNNQMRLGEQNLELLTTPTPLQRRAFELLEVPCR
jgi:transposase